MGTIVYRYGLLQPTVGAEHVERQLLSAHRYRNDRIQIERGRRAAVRELYSEFEAIRRFESEAEAATIAHEEADTAIKRERASSRARTDSTESKAALKAAKEAKRDAVGALRLAQAYLKVNGEALGLDLKLKAIEERASELAKSAYQFSGANWGCRAIVDEARDKSRDAQSKNDGFFPDAEGDPRFVRWTGDGSVGVQVHQKGLMKEGFTLAELESNGWLEIHRAPAPVVSMRAIQAWDRGGRKGPKPGTGKRFQQGFHTLRMRVGSDAEKEAIIAEWPMKMHRPLPPGCVIRRATVNRRVRGRTVEWYVTLTVRTLAANDVGQKAGNHVVGLDIGWRTAEDGSLRVGFTSDGEKLELTKDDISALTYGSVIRGHQDTAHERACHALDNWLREQGEADERWSWLRDATATMMTSHDGKRVVQWRATWRLAGVVEQWAKRDGVALKRQPKSMTEIHFTPRMTPEEIRDALLDWRHSNLHLIDWIPGQTKRGLRRRQNIYRNFAARITERADAVAVEDIDLSKMARRPKTEDDAQNKVAASNRFLAATSELLEAIKNACARRGTKFIKVDPTMTTRTCNECGHVENWDTAKRVHHACSRCGVIWDQDENAAKNVAELGREHLNGVDVAAPARKAKEGKKIKPEGVSRWQWVKMQKAEREVQRETARKAMLN